MKMILLSALLLAACGSHPETSRVHARTTDQTTQTAPAPEAVVRDFYTWYTGELNRDNWEPLKNRREALKYLTPEFHKRVPRLTRELMADVIICAQDWEKSWATNFTVGRPSVRGARATAVVRLPAGGDAAIRIKVTLVRRGGEWRINNSECVD
ncbi:MAG: DUF3828 domain-containing protein [Pyrinomonadaceae bacterium]